MTRVPASHRRRSARRSSSTSPPHTPCAPTPNACRSESSRQSGRTGQRAQTAMACAAWSLALATSRVTGNQSSGSTREPAHRASRYTRPASSPSVRSCGSRRTWHGFETISTWLHLLPSGCPPAALRPARRSIVSGRQRLRIPSPVSDEPSTSGMRARGWRRQAGIMSVTLCVELGDQVLDLACGNPFGQRLQYRVGGQARRRVVGTEPLPSGTRSCSATWGLGESRARRSSEIAALRRGVDIGMNLIDTAEMYANGDAEILVGEAIAAAAKRSSWSPRCCRTTRPGRARCRPARAACGG